MWLSLEYNGKKVSLEATSPLQFTKENGWYSYSLLEWLPCSRTSTLSGKQGESMKKVTISFLVKDVHDQAELDRTMSATKFYLTLVELSQFLRQGRKYGQVGRLKLDNLLKTENGQELFDEVEEAFYEILKENNINSLSEYDG